MNRKYYIENDSITLKNEDHIQEFVICEQVGHGVLSTGYKAVKKNSGWQRCKALD